MLDAEAARLVDEATDYLRSGNQYSYVRKLQQAAEWCMNRGNQANAIELMTLAFNGAGKANDNNGAAYCASWMVQHTSGRDKRDWQETLDSLTRHN